MSKTVLSETRDNTGKVGLQTSTAVMSDRTVRDDGNVLCRPCPVWQALTTLAMEHVQCAGGGVYGEIFVSALPNRLDAFSLLFTR